MNRKRQPAHTSDGAIARALFVVPLAVSLAFGLTLPVPAAEVWPGVEVLVRELPGELKGMRIGIVTNPTGVDRRLNSTIDLVRALPGVEVVRLFAPEHGIRGGFYAGDHVDETKDPISGLPIASLYGDTRRPTPEMLAGLDAILYDIQDIGHRSYTFVSTLTYVMEACEKAGVTVWVLDRPDPMGGNIVGGPMMDDGLRSFIGIHSVPLVYGMTPGEWARMIQVERTPRLELRVVHMKGWKRGMTYGDLGWPWVPPSQHIPRWESAYFYAMTGTIGELGQVNEGVGTPLPFELIGAPWLDGVGLAAEMNALGLPGVLFRAATFSPRYGMHDGKTCQGIQIHLIDPRRVQPARINMELMAALIRAAPSRNIFRHQKDRIDNPTMFMKALGDAKLIETLASGADPRSHRARIETELNAFLERRARYLLYD